MPELPDIEVYLAALRTHVLGERLVRIRIVSPSVLRTYDPPIEEAQGRTVTDLRRVGKRIAIGLDDAVFLVVHLMVSGRLVWTSSGAPIPKKTGLAAFGFTSGTILLTEASTKRRASLEVVRDLSVVDRGGAEPLDVDRAAFAAILQTKNRTLKRALTDPTALAGIGNAYSDEILHRARLSPQQRTGNLDDDAVTRLYESMQTVLAEWTARLLDEAGGGFPKKVTAFHPEMAVHGKYGQPCPICGTPVQRVAAEREYHYCPTCQTGGRLLADRAMSRFLKGDRPKRVEDL